MNPSFAVEKGLQAALYFPSHTSLICLRRRSNMADGHGTADMSGGTGLWRKARLEENRHADI